MVVKLACGDYTSVSQNLAKITMKPASFDVNNLRTEQVSSLLIRVHADQERGRRLERL